MKLNKFSYLFLTFLFYTAVTFSMSPSIRRQVKRIEQLISERAVAFQNEIQSQINQIKNVAIDAAAALQEKLDNALKKIKEEKIDFVEGFVGYVPITILNPGQLRFTQYNVNTKAKKLANTKQQFNNATSSIAEKEPIPVILGPDGLVILVDSHHEMLAAKQVGDITVPIKVIKDLSNLSRPEFYQQAQALNLIYPVDLNGSIVQMPATGWFTWNQMQDDPNRLWASFTAWKCVKENGGFKGFKDPNATQDPEYPIWVKKLWEKVKTAFIEFKIATTLYKAGIKFDYNWGTNPNDPTVQEFSEKAREVLKNNPVPGLDLIYPMMPRSEINKDQGGICAYTYQEESL